MFPRIFLLGACILIGSCTQDRPLDCGQVQRAISSCMDGKVANRGDRAFFEACIPMLKAKTFKGSWSRDFEFNVFRENQTVKADQAFNLPARWVELVVEGTALDKLQKPGAAQVFQVSFIGRKPVCNLTEPVSYVLVDRILSARLVNERPSAF